jgi:hypothetical protein
LPQRRSSRHARAVSRRADRANFTVPAHGHEAILAAPALYRGLAEAFDVPSAPLDLDRLAAALAAGPDCGTC